MHYPNILSTTISKKDLSEITDALKFIDEKLSDLITLNREELDALPKTGTETINFVLQNLKEAERTPEIVPKNVDIEEIRKDVKLIHSIYKILDPLQKLEKKLEDSAMLAGSEAYLPSIAIYNAMKADVIRKRQVSQKVRA